MFEEFGINAGYVEELHGQYLQSPQSIDEKWRSFFEGKTARAGETNGGNGPSAQVGGDLPQLAVVHANGQRATLAVQPAAVLQGRVVELVNAYRVRGHLFANIDPLGQPPQAPPELDLVNFGLNETDLDRVFGTAGIVGLKPTATLRQIIGHLQETYCGSIGVEFTQIEDPMMREWLQEKMESTRNRLTLERSECIRILTKLTDAEIFEQYIHKNFVGAKRFSAEGAESMIAMLDLLIEAAGAHAVEEIVLGMAHRGRLNVLVNTMGKNPRELFAAFEDKRPERFLGTGDVKYHLGYSNDVVTPSGNSVHLTLAFNPSHLEFVNPVVEGRVRAKQDRRRTQNVMPLLIHGDAAFIGQGIVPETLNLAQLAGYNTGGTVHLVVNNQIGFTTLPADSRSTRYCTDITRMLRVPVFHVNGEDPEAVIQVTRLAIEFRQRFHQDVVIDMYCYRRYGHNETDEPRFTQPVMYALIDQKPTVREVYVRHLVLRGIVTQDQADEIAAGRKAALDQAREEAKTGDYHRMPEAMGGLWTQYRGGLDERVPDAETGVPKETLVKLLDKMATMPTDFKPNPKVLKVLEARRDRARAGEALDWGTAETLAFATLVTEGHRVRLSGQDAGRGTFTHRHAVLHDSETGKVHKPLTQLSSTQAIFDVIDSPLSEAGALGFEYGYSLDRPDGLVLWEAQFGDFANGAQVIVDQFLVSAEDKWSRLSGLVLLLPHGYEGQGPEHSSARIERFLQLAAEDNIQICNVTASSQIFHLLRRQVLRPIRKPLVIFTPKSTLRATTSTIADFTKGTFQRVIGDTGFDPKLAKKILLCSGRVYFDLEKMRRESGRTDVAIVRLEQYYPISNALQAALEVYAPGTPLVWVQDEPRNMGAAYFLNARIGEFIGDRHPFSIVSRVESASPATGSHASHQLEQTMLLEDAFLS
jgi:2-oxoglutarate dehydrogenase E1 component